jgi:hypothetical protein
VTAGHLLLERILKLTSAAVELVAKVGGGYLGGRRFASLGRNGALPLRRLSAFTASPHVAP